jgi:hypothetical protein
VDDELKDGKLIDWEGRLRIAALIGFAAVIVVTVLSSL